MRITTIRIIASFAYARQYPLKELSRIFRSRKGKFQSLTFEHFNYWTNRTMQVYTWPGGLGLPTLDYESLTSLFCSRIVFPKEVECMQTPREVASPSGRLPCLKGESTSQVYSREGIMRYILAVQGDGLAPEVESSVFAMHAFIRVTLESLVLYSIYGDAETWRTCALAMTAESSQLLGAKWSMLSVRDKAVCALRKTHPSWTQLVFDEDKENDDSGMEKAPASRWEAAKQAVSFKPDVTRKAHVAFGSAAFEQKARHILQAFEKKLGDRYFLGGSPTTVDAHVAALIMLLIKVAPSKLPVSLLQEESPRVLSMAERLGEELINGRQASVPDIFTQLVSEPRNAWLDWAGSWWNKGSLRDVSNPKPESARGQQWSLGTPGLWLHVIGILGGTALYFVATGSVLVETEEDEEGIDAAQAEQARAAEREVSEGDEPDDEPYEEEEADDESELEEDLLDEVDFEEDDE